MSKKTVLITGATGYIVSQFLDAFRTRYNLRLLDTRATNREGEPVEGVEVVDLLAAEMDDLTPYFEGVDTVVHSAYVRPPKDADLREEYAYERQNIDLAYRIFQLALETDVRRVVAMSTNQAAKWYENPYFAGERDRITPYEFPKAERYYGWAKAAYESLGFVYACGNYGRKLENIHIRIVAPREIDPHRYDDLPLHRYLRDITGYLSPRDLEQLVRKCVDTPNIDDEEGIPFHIFYGVSNNARTFWSITNARQVVGYNPEDDAEMRFADDIQEIVRRKRS